MPQVPENPVADHLAPPRTVVALKLYRSGQSLEQCQGNCGRSMLEGDLPDESSLVNFGTAKYLDFRRGRYRDGRDIYLKATAKKKSTRFPSARGSTRRCGIVRMVAINDRR